MDARVKAGILWGLVGALSFLVLAQAYYLYAGRTVGVAATAAVAVLVGCAATGVAYYLEKKGLNARPK